MSLVDELREIEQQVSRRLQELEPMVAEYQELREVADRIGTRMAAAGVPVAPRTTAPRTGSRRAASASRARASAKPAAGRKSATPRKRGAAASAAKPKAAAARRAAAVKSATNGRLPGKRDEDIIRLVAAQPGITVAQVGKELGVDPTGLYRVVKRLQASGYIRKQGVALKPAATG
jgi:CRP-like cAMP-binding protein